MRQADGVASARRLTKRMPFCNGKDTESSPARKAAEFWRVLCREKIKRTSLKEESQMTVIRVVHLLLVGLRLLMCIAKVVLTYITILTFLYKCNHI